MTRLPKKISLVAQTAVAIREAISLAHWKSWLPGEHELCGHLHASRRTIRAALEQFSQNGILKCPQGKRREIADVQNRPRMPSSKSVVVLLPVPVLSLSPFGLFGLERQRACPASGQAYSACARQTSKPVTDSNGICRYDQSSNSF